MRRFLCILAVAAGTLALGPDVLLPQIAEAQKPQLIRLKVGASDTLNLGGTPKEISVENTEIATVEVLEDGQVKVTGIAEGNTTLIGTAADESVLVMPIIVEPKKKVPPADE